MAIEVRATKLGYYRGRRRVGETFVIHDEKEFSEKWMVKTAKDEPRGKGGKGGKPANPPKDEPEVTPQVGDGDQPPPKGEK